MLSEQVAEWSTTLLGRLLHHTSCQPSNLTRVGFVTQLRKNCSHATAERRSQKANRVWLKRQDRAVCPAAIAQCEHCAHARGRRRRHFDIGRDQLAQQPEAVWHPAAGSARSHVRDQEAGTGKSTLLATMLPRQDIEQGRGVALLDPHGDLCERVLQSVRRKRARTTSSTSMFLMPRRPSPSIRLS